MILNESIVEYSALEWFGKLGYAVGHGPQIAPGEPAAEQNSFSEVVLAGRLREAMMWERSDGSKAASNEDPEVCDHGCWMNTLSGWG